MGEVIKDSEGIRFASSTLIPRKHVIPERGIILNQTMTIDNGSSLSQSEVHLEIFENVCALPSVTSATRPPRSSVIPSRVMPSSSRASRPTTRCER